MTEVLAQLSNLTFSLAIVAVIAVGASTAWSMRTLKSLNADLDENRNPVPPIDATEANESNGFRTSVATPRARKLQPPGRSSDQVPASETETPAVAGGSLAVSAPEAAPVKPSTTPSRETELAEPVLASAAVSPVGEAAKNVPSQSETLAPAGALVLGTLAAGTDIPAAPAPKADLPIIPLAPATTLPPLAVSGPGSTLPAPATRPEELPVASRKFFGAAAPAGALTASVNPPSELTPAGPVSKGKEETALPLLSTVIPAATDLGKPPVTLPSEVRANLASLKAAESAPEAVKSGPTSVATPETPKIEQAGDGLVAVGAPIKITGDADVPPVSAQDADDVKKKAPRTPAPEPPAASAGLILIPPADSKPEPLAAKSAETPASPDPKPEATAAPEKAAEPVLSPAVADAVVEAAPAAKPEVEAKPVKGPRVFLPGRFFGGSKNKDKEAAEKAAESAAAAPVAKAEPETPKITEPASAPALVVPPVEEAAPAADAKPAVEPIAKVEEKPVEVVTAKSEETPASKDKEPAAPEAAAKTPETPVVVAPATKPDEAVKPAAEKTADKVQPSPAPKVAEPVVPPAPVAKIPEKKAEDIASVPLISTEKAKLPAAPERSSLVATSQTAPAAKPDATALPTLPTQAGPTTEPMAEPIVSVTTPAPAAKPETPAQTLAPTTTPAAPAAPASPAVPVPVPSLGKTPAPAPIASIKPHPVMPPNETTTSLPNNGRASAQLTLGFEITSLQLTPFFKLGSVQLKALSNVVSLHLVAAQADNPLAAGISFQIERVDLDGASHLKSILLTPLGESRAATVPMPKLQVDNVAITSGGDGAPISVTTSEQASTAVQLLGTFTIAAMDFTPAFEIGSLRLEPTSNTVLLRVAPSSRPTALDLPPSFEVAAVQLADGAQIGGMRLTPSAAKAA